MLKALSGTICFIQSTIHINVAVMHIKVLFDEEKEKREIEKLDRDEKDELRSCYEIKYEFC